MSDLTPRLDRRMFIRVLGSVVWAPRFGCDAESAAVDAAVGEPLDSGQCPAFLTPVAEHFRQFGGRAHIEGWQMPTLTEHALLRVSGLVEHELTLSLPELEASKETLRVLKTMVCVFGLTSTAVWTGIPLRALFERAGVDRARAVRARFLGYDGFENNLPLTAIYDNQAAFEPLIAFQLYGARLPVEHGFPFRLLLADRYGYKNIKWLERIELTDRDEPTGQYQESGYSDAGFIELQVIAEGVRVNETVPVGPLELCGFAVSGYAGIEQVEVSVDGGDAQPATLTTASQLALQEPQLAQTMQVLNPAHTGFAGVWSAWHITVQVVAGAQRVQIRARDRAGHMTQATDLQLTGR